MAGPFPGMDPYIEAQGNWQDFHNRLIAEISNALGARLPENYVARVDERIEVVGPDPGDGPGEEAAGTAYRPDVLIARGQGPAAVAVLDAPAAAIAPVFIEVVDRDPDEIRHTWLEIRRLPDLELVTVIEVLSPINKTWPGRPKYLAKRDDLHARRVHLVEIDLLLGGHRPPMKQPLTGGDYFAIVARGPKLPVAEVYAWPVRSPLPTIPIPLKAPDPDVRIDLQELANRVYDLGRYRRTLPHGRPLPENLPLGDADRAWAEGLGKPPA